MLGYSCDKFLRKGGKCMIRTADSVSLNFLLNTDDACVLVVLTNYTLS